MFKKILVALDRSSQAAAVFDFALSIARPEISQMLLVHFIDWEMRDLPPWIGIATLYDINLYSDRNSGSRQYLEEEIETSNHWLKIYAQKATARKISCQHECYVGSSSLGISDRAQQWGADVIVIGRRGHRHLSEIFLGSVSNYVVHSAPCSILIVQGTQTLKANELAKADN